MAFEAKADYQKYIYEMVSTASYPFDKPYVLIQAVKERLIAGKYSKYGDKGVSEALKDSGYRSYRGTVKVSGQIYHTPTFWTAESLDSLKPKELHEWFEAKKAESNRQNRELSGQFQRGFNGQG
jgi:hypothetical protein